jgi:hypothetical protein
MKLSTELEEVKEKLLLSMERWEQLCEEVEE